MPARGTFLRAEQTCNPYFQCLPGYYQQFDIGGSSSCQPCSIGLAAAQPLFAMWSTHGLAANDPLSCIAECQRGLALPYVSSRISLCQQKGISRLLTNEPGWYGVSEPAQCSSGFTSERATALTVSDCRPCPLPPANAARVYSDTTQCPWSCNPRYEQRGGACVRPSQDVPANPWQRAGQARLTGVTASSPVQAVSVDFVVPSDGPVKAAARDLVAPGDWMVTATARNCYALSKIWSGDGVYSHQVCKDVRFFHGICLRPCV